LKLAILGSGTAIPHPARGASGYACLADDGSALLLECGPGSTRRWPAHGITPEAVRGIVCTHHHLDHVSDLGAFLFLRNVIEPPLETRVVLAGPEGHRDLIDGLTEAHGVSIADRRGLHDVVDLSDGDSLEVAPFSISSRHVLHSDGALGVRVDAGGRSLAFSGDTGPCDALVELLSGVDVALLECSYPAARPTQSHMNTTTAAQMAKAAGVGRLVLTHFYPMCDDVDVEAEVRDAGYEGDLELAVDGAVYVV